MTPHTEPALTQEIARLREALQQIANPPLGTGPNLHECVVIARKALGPSQ